MRKCLFALSFVFLFLLCFCATEECRIIAGSLEGILRIFYPRRYEGRSHQVEDLLMEKDLGLPILGLSVGRTGFGTSRNVTTLIVLHPRMVATYSLGDTSGAAGGAGGNGGGAFKPVWYFYYRRA